MNATDLLKRLKAEGVGVSLNLKVTADEKPSDDTRALIRDNRDALLEYLARELVGTPKTYGGAFLKLMSWAAQYGDMRLEHPSGVVIDPRPVHIRDARELSSWGVIYGSSGAVLAIWGNVPARELQSLHDLKTNKLLAPETVAA